MEIFLLACVPLVCFHDASLWSNCRGARIVWYIGMKVFISYHRADTQYRRNAEKILSAHGIQYYAVPEDADFNGKRNETIRNFTCNKVKKCDVLLCLIGKETYSRPHVDREIHTALKGGVGTRLGIVGVLLPTRTDSLSQADFSTLPTKLIDNKNYVVWSDWSSMERNILVLLTKAEEHSCNSKLQSKHTNPCMLLKSKIYYDN